MITAKEDYKMHSRAEVDYRFLNTGGTCATRVGWGVRIEENRRVRGKRKSKRGREQSESFLDACVHYIQ